MTRRTPRLLIALVAAFVLVLAACSSSGDDDGSASDTSEATTTTDAGPAPIQHVFVINLENKGFDETFGADSPADYLASLVDEGQLLPEYYGIGHASLGNYLAQISGQPPSESTQRDCVTYTDFAATGTDADGIVAGDGCVYPAEVPTVAGQLEDADLTWGGFMEDMGEPCRHPVIGEVDETQIARADDQYAARHNPFVYFHSIIDDEASCQEHVVDLSELPAALESADTTPNLVYITPDLCSDAHDEPCVDGRPGGLESADDFLEEWVPQIFDSPAYQAGGLLVITFDEAELAGDQGDSSACCDEPTGPNVDQPGINGPGGGRTGAVLLSPRIDAGSTDETPYNHYGLLCGIEDLFGLDHLGYAAQAGLDCVAADLAPSAGAADVAAGADGAGATTTTGG